MNEAISGTPPLTRAAPEAPTRSGALVSATRGVGEINPKVSRFVFESASRFGLTPSRMSELLALGSSELESVRERMSWNVFATLLNAYEAERSRERFLEEFWHSFTREPINAHLMKIFRSLASPTSLYYIMDRYIGPRLMPCLLGRSQVLESGLLAQHIELKSPRGAVPCEVYFHLIGRSLQQAPAMMMGLEHSVLLDFETDGLQARYTFRLPPSRSLLGRLRDAARIFTGARSLFNLLENHQQEQQQTFSHLQRLNEELEGRVLRRTKELAALNQELSLARDRAERESASKSRYLADMSHEIRTPLSAIIGYAELLEEDAIEQVDEQSAEDLRSITASAKYLLALIGDILDISKIEADKLTIVPKKVALDQLLLDLAQAFKPLAARRGNQLVIQCGEAASAAPLYTDPMRLRQILTNLLSNAVKFTKRGEITVRVTASLPEPSITFEVMDTGSGMSEAELDMIFEPFEQATDMTQHTHGGTGLGMTISRQLAELMGGRLVATSTPGHGSTFTLTMPLDLKSARPHA